MPVERNTVNVEVYGTPIKALVDTGATISCVAASLLTKFDKERCQIISTTATDAVAVGGERHCSLGVVSLPVSFGGPIIDQNFQVF